ncbi:hypothetical protein QUH73_04350 [Labilibaculum sp. K2S]|uniref:hypothetical protein n=1 Tax=Labilibaculum sp. K2S TaxID=3056386 RepID=UPI0025A36F22|nr:hypothetical protein [Labilibaculum sp. K2S]MDM8159046.1 hypothetical protein [Labilibaculum sp. K2S]
MKTGHIILIGGVVTALVFKDDIIPYVSGKTSEIKDKIISYTTSKISITPKGFPRLGVDFLRGAITLKGSIELSTKVGLSATLNSYQINLVLEQGDKKLSLGKTPLLTPNKEIKGNSKTAVNYVFAVKLDSISKLLESKELLSYGLFLYVDSLRVNGLDMPGVKIDISKTWRDIAGKVKNPASVITDLYNQF